MIYSILLERVNAVGLIQELIAEHAELETQTRKIRESIKLLESGIASREESKKQLSTFLIRQRQHMYIEEKKVHPLIEKNLTNRDWDHVQSTVPLYKK